MRFEKAKNLLQLATAMQGTRAGISLHDIEQKFEVGKRTAQRMRSALEDLFPQLEEVDTGEYVKRWRLPAGVVNKFINIDAEDIANLDMAASLLERDNLYAQAKSLKETVDKIKTLIPTTLGGRIEPDIDALLESEGIALRAGPKPKFDPEIIKQIQYAIKANLKIKISYKKRYEQNPKLTNVRPYGIILGHRHYLVACIDHPKANKILPYSIPNIQSVEILEDFFEVPDTFDLANHVGQSFGVFQEEPFTTIWRFSARAAPHAEEFLFHPTQIMELLEDGGLKVTIFAGGLLEMAWHLMTWGKEVTVIEPKKLADIVHPVQCDWRGLP